MIAVAIKQLNSHCNSIHCNSPVGTLVLKLETVGEKREKLRGVGSFAKLQEQNQKTEKYIDMMRSKPEYVAENSRLHTRASFVVLRSR